MEQEEQKAAQMIGEEACLKRNGKCEESKREGTLSPDTLFCFADSH